MNSEFEKRLQDQPMREVPSNWRARILDAAPPAPVGTARVPSEAHSAKGGRAVRGCFLPERSPRRGDPTSPKPAVADAPPWWRQWLWPCPKAWAGLAAAWVLILVMNLAMGKDPAQTANARLALSRQELKELRQQQQTLAELIFSGETVEDEPPKAIPSPHSERPRNRAAV